MKHELNTFFGVMGLRKAILWHQEAKDSESDPDKDVVEIVTNKKKKQSRKDEDIVTDLKELHGQPMQYRI